jgi:hypothetical protein
MNVILLTCLTVENLGSLRDARVNKAKFRKHDEAASVVSKVHSADLIRMEYRRPRYDTRGSK